MDLYLVVNGRARHYAYDKSAFGDAARQGGTKPSSGFSGVRISRKGAGKNAGSIGAHGGAASFFANGLYESIGEGQVAGATARPVKVRWQDRGEETPAIRTLWIEEPSAGASAIVLHALLDAPSLAGACQFTLRPNGTTIIDVECNIFARATLEQVGYGVLNAAHYLSPMGKKSVEDVRPAIYEVAGLKMYSGRDEWIWRPVANRPRLEASAFVDDNPLGYGLVQKDREVSVFLDDENQWQRRPTVWIEPIEEWGAGEIVLLEIPATSPLNKNIVAYWRPKAPPKAKSEASFAFRQYWGWGLPDKPRTATVSHSRIGRVAGKTGRVRFLVQFEGGELANKDPAVHVTPSITASAGKISDMKVYRSTESGSVRVLFDLDPGAESLSELRLVLMANGAPKSETWLFRWTP
jgi:glucans biosynthesis protein